MRRSIVTGVILLLVGGCTSAPEPPAPEPSPPEAPDLGEGWISLFDGSSLDGWKAADSGDSFSVRDGMIVVDGPMGHLYYVGDAGDHDFTDFEFRAHVMTAPGSNSGIYFHTRYQPTDWPRQGYEVQVNQSHVDPQRTGGLYDVAKVSEPPAEDGVWFTLEISVLGKQVITKVNGKTLVDYTEPENPQRLEGWEGRRLSSGTFALQAHDPKSKVYFANIMVKPLPD
ncbi:MAG: 3-keto-disaccharide hydrolase [Planctomycetota bacterium]|jgi:hypothetical protein